MILTALSKDNFPSAKPNSIPALNVFVSPEVSGKVTVVTVGAAITPSQPVGPVTLVPGIDTSALSELIVILGMSPSPSVIKALTSIVASMDPSTVTVTSLSGSVMTT